MASRAERRDRADLAHMLTEWRAFKARAWTVIATAAWTFAGLYAAALWIIPS